jgi:DNA-directed RNA polymerase specialized sigma subunit
MESHLTFDTDSGVHDTVADMIPGNIDPVLETENKLLHEDIKKGIETLNERERYIITQLHFENRERKDIAMDLGIKHSRMCQLITQIYSKMAVFLKERDIDLEW